MTTEPTRDEVNDLLTYADNYQHDPYAPVAPDHLRALCRAWLALHDAPVGPLEVAGGGMMVVHAHAEALDGKTVSLVVVD